MKTEEKYLKFLQELHNILKYTDKVSLYQICRDHGVSASLSTVLIEGGIIKKTGRDGQSNLYKWNSIQPNLTMAKEAKNRLYNYVNGKNNEAKAAKKKAVTVEKTAVKSPAYYEGSFLGFKIKLKPIYA